MCTHALAAHYGDFQALIGLDTEVHEGEAVARQIVTRANRSIGETGPIYAALGVAEGVSPAEMQKNLQARTRGTPAAEARRQSLSAVDLLPGLSSFRS